MKGYHDMIDKDKFSLIITKEMIRVKHDLHMLEFQFFILVLDKSGVIAACVALWMIVTFFALFLLCCKIFGKALRPAVVEFVQ